jgi:hypothetical protein
MRGLLGGPTEVRSSYSRDEGSSVANTLPLLSASLAPDDDIAVVKRLAGQIQANLPGLIRLNRYYEGQQRLEHIGLAVPPELRHFETVVNVPRMAVDEPERRQSLRAFYRVGNSTLEDPALREAWDRNNLASESSLMQKDEKVYGRSFVAVGTNPDDPQHPLITVESPLQMGFEVDAQRRRFRHLLRLYVDPFSLTTFGTLYTPEHTTGYAFSGGKWTVTSRDDHGLGRVPVVMFLNRRRAGSYWGTSEMADVLGMTDAIARMFTNMQVGAESHALPSWFISGVDQRDFVDQNGNPVPVWESYLGKLKALTNPNAKVQQFQAGDLKNFTDSINNMFAWCAAVLGLPTRYAGQQTVNPATAEAIDADESRLVRNVERMNTHDADSWAWVMGLEERFRTGSWDAFNTIRATYQDPKTPTLAQIADAALKLKTQHILSTEGVWDLLGWDEARKQQERARLDKEAASDPFAIAAQALSGQPTTPPASATQLPNAPASNASVSSS